MAAIDRAPQIQAPSPFHQLLLHGEVREIVRRVVSAVAYFFQMAVQILATGIDQGVFILQKSSVRTFALDGVPSAEKGAIIDLALRILPREEFGFEWRFLPRAISQIPAAEREEVIRFASPLFNDLMSSLDKRFIISVIGKVAAAEREEVMRFALPLFVNELSGQNKAFIIEDIREIAAAEREEVFRFASEFFTNLMGGYDKSLIIRAINKVAAVERAEVLRFALQVCTHQPIEWGMNEIIRVIDRIPANQREDVIRQALRFITPEMNGFERQDVIHEIARMPAHQRNNLVLPPRRRRGINVHAGNRDQKTREAIALLRRAQGNLSSRQMEQAQRAFIEYLDTSPFNEADKAIVKRVLFTPKEDLPPGDPRRELFGPLIDDREFSILGLMMTGREILARHWLYASSLPESRENHEQTNAKHGMIRALIDCCLENGHRLCNQGKTQRLAVAVLQGRLRGVNIEEDDSQRQVRTNVAMSMFFNTTDHQRIDQLAPLLEAANRFCDQNALVNREEFLGQIREYARQGQIE